MFGFFRAADLGQQYDTASRVGGNFSFLFDTFILLCITFGVVRSLSSQVGLPWFIPPRGILLRVGPHPKFISGSSLRGVVTRAVFSSNCCGFLGTLAFWDTTNAPLRLPSHFSEILRSAPFTAPALAGPLKACFSLTKLVTTTSSISSSAPPAPLGFRLVSLVLR